MAQACSGPGRGQARTNLLGDASNGIDSSNRVSARVGDSFMGSFLSCALLPILGNRLLLLSQQLFHCRLRRRGSPVDLATLRPFGRRHWRVDVRNINKCSFCPRHPAARPRHTVLGWKEADGQSIACRSWRIDEFGGTKPCLKPISRLPMSVMR